MNGLEQRLARALGDAGERLTPPAGRLHVVMARGARRRRAARLAAALSGLALVTAATAATAWAFGGGAGVAPAGSGAPAVTDTTVEFSTGTAPPTTSVDGTTDVVPTTVEFSVGTALPAGGNDPAPATDEFSVGTAPPTTSVTGESDPVPTTVAFSQGTAPPTTAVSGESDPVPATAAGELLDCPVQGDVEPTDDFGVTRENDRVHLGVDIPADPGTPVYAVSAGTVRTRTGPLTGNAAYLTDGARTLYVYAHLDGFTVADGAAVGPGDQIGTVGETGNAERPQLHFEIRPGGGAAIDPHPAVAAACG